MRPDLLVVVGPTAVGKTHLTIEVAKILSGEIVSADSMQVYRGMDIGTAKPTLAEQQGIPHHLIDVVEPTEDFSVARYQELADTAISEIGRRGNVPILTGGTGLYVRAVIDGFLFEDEGKDEELRRRLNREAKLYGNDYLHRKLAEVDPETAARLHPNDIRRVIRALEVYEHGTPLSVRIAAAENRPPKYDVVMFGLTRERENLYERINTRVDAQIDAGLVAEVRALLKRGVSPDNTAMQGLGYKEMVAYLQGDCSFEEAVRVLKRDTRRYAKRQYTWFRRDRRIEWLNLDEITEAEAVEYLASAFQRHSQAKGKSLCSGELHSTTDAHGLETGGSSCHE